MKPRVIYLSLVLHTGCFNSVYSIGNRKKALINLVYVMPLYALRLPGYCMNNCRTSILNDLSLFCMEYITLGSVNSLASMFAVMNFRKNNSLVALPSCQVKKEILSRHDSISSPWVVVVSISILILYYILKFVCVWPKTCHCDKNLFSDPQIFVIFPRLCI